jgi:hypothetical protein
MHDESKPAPVTQVIEFGDLKVTVEAPELKTTTVFVSIRPESAEDFEAVVAATGGWDGLKMPTIDQGHSGYATRANDGVTLMIYEPPRTIEAALRTHPFFGRYADRTETTA